MPSRLSVVWLFWLALWSIAILVDSRPGFSQAPPAAGTPPSILAPAITPAAIEQAVKDLGHEEFAIRERATEFLIGAGEAAMAAVEAAAKSTDPEVALRAKIVLKRLTSGVRPGTPAELASLIEDFQAADRKGKGNLIYKLEKPEEFHVISDVIAKEKDVSQRQTYESILKGRVTSLASQHFRTNRIDDAETLLGSREGDTTSEAMLLTLQLVTNHLPQRAEQLTATLAAKANPTGQRRLALMHRAAGDLIKARAAAEKLEAKDLAMWLAIEGADWPAALLLNLERYSGKEPTTEQLAFTLLLSHYAQDKNVFETAKAELLKRAADRPAELWPAAEALLVSEQFDEAIELLKRGVPAAAFYLLWYGHNFDAALALAEAQEGTIFDADWLARLPDGGRVATSLAIRRTDFAGDIAGTLHYVGRKGEARQVLDLVRESIKHEPGSNMAWYDLVETDLRLGLREQALADAAVPLSRPAGSPQPNPDSGTTYVYSSHILNELYGRDFVQRSTLFWSQIWAACDGDARVALPLVEPLFHLPTAGKLSTDERRARLDALAAVPTGRDRYRYLQHLRQIGMLAARAGDEEYAYRSRLRAAMLMGSGSTYSFMQRGDEAFNDRDWATAVQQLRRFEQAGSSSNQQQDYMGIALLKLGQREEGEKYLEQALKWRIDPGAYSAQGQLLLTHELKAEAAARLRTATRLMPPGDGTTINAINSLGNALYLQSPTEATSLWKVNMFGPLVGTSDMTLDMYLKNGAVIRREMARAAVAKGRFREAADHALAELAAMPGDVVGVEQLVPLFDEKGQRALGDEVFERSVWSYSRVCTNFPRAASHRNLLARTSARCNRRLDEALALAKEAIALEPEDANFHATLAEVQLARGDKQAAIAAAQAGLALEPKHAVCEKVLAKAKGTP